jgi:glycosyltransferase involved in cell wall biosynthesis
MHVLVVALGFPSRENPFPGSFLGQQVRFVCECPEISYVTVLCPTTIVPPFLQRLRGAGAAAELPRSYEMIAGRCRVLFPRYYKAPGDWLLSWTTQQWCRMIDRTIGELESSRPVSLVHANYGGLCSWTSVWAARKRQIPCAVTYQGDDVNTLLARRRKGWQLCRDSFRLADLNLPVSRALENELKRNVGSGGTCRTLLRGVDQTWFYPAPQLASSPTLLFVGRIEEAKGAFDLLQGWVQVRRQCPDASLVIVGPDCTNGAFAQRARTLGLTESITFTGPVSSADVAGWMRRSRLLCLPSHGEGTPNCVTEALACGLPVVATDVGGIPDVVDHGRTGLVVPRGDTEALAAALTELLRSYPRCVEMGRAAHGFALRELDGRKSAKRLVAHYQELVQARRFERSQCAEAVS